MHGGPDCPGDVVRAGDAWLSLWIPRILASRAWQQGGALFITWDEDHGPGHRMAEARRAYEAEMDPGRKRVKGAMYAGKRQ